MNLQRVVVVSWSLCIALAACAPRRPATVASTEDDARAAWCAHVRDAYCGRCGCTDIQRAGVLTSCRVMVRPATVARGASAGVGDPACRAALDAIGCAEAGVLPDTALPEACR